MPTLLERRGLRSHISNKVNFGALQKAPSPSNRGVSSSQPKTTAKTAAKAIEAIAHAVMSPTHVLRRAAAEANLARSSLKTANKQQKLRRRTVAFSIADVEEYAVTPYSLKYGRPLSSFVFDRTGSMKEVDNNSDSDDDDHQDARNQAARCIIGANVGPIGQGSARFKMMAQRKAMADVKDV